MTDIVANLEGVWNRIGAAAARVDRDPAEITLIAVTKTHPVDAIEQAFQAGIRHFAENKVQEAMRKLPFLGKTYDGFHFIGHLQSNKINQLISLDPILVQSIDSYYIAEKLDSTLKRYNRNMDILIQVNTSREDSKSGINIEEAIQLVEQVSMLKALHIKGLMTIGKYYIDSELCRPNFRTLKQIFDEIKALDLPGVEMKHLSMGMTDDYEIAIEEGANMLRIGSAIFGSRKSGE